MNTNNNEHIVSHIERIELDTQISLELVSNVLDGVGENISYASD